MPLSIEKIISFFRGAAKQSVGPFMNRPADIAASLSEWFRKRALSESLMMLAAANNVAGMKRLVAKGADVNHRGWVQYRRGGKHLDCTALSHQKYPGYRSMASSHHTPNATIVALDAGAFDAALYLMSEAKANTTFGWMIDDPNALNLIVTDRTRCDGTHFDPYTASQRKILLDALILNRKERGENLINLVGAQTLRSVVTLGRKELRPAIEQVFNTAPDRTLAAATLAYIGADPRGLDFATLPQTVFRGGPFAPTPAADT